MYWMASMGVGSWQSLGARTDTPHTHNTHTTHTTHTTRNTHTHTLTHTGYGF